MTDKSCIVRAVLFSLASLTACPLVTSTLAGPAVPAGQSICEIRANRFKARHPHTDPFDYLRLGFFPFGPAIPPKPPWSYLDPGSGITFHVENDGRHLVAVNSRGKLLWIRNPFVDSNMCPYRSAHPYIYDIGPANAQSGKITNDFIVKEINNEIARGAKFKLPEPRAHFIALTFNSSQSGWINVENGDFYWQGQN